MDQLPEPSAWERFQKFLRDSATVKLFVIGFIILVLLIPISFVRDLVYERQSRKNDAVMEISNTWGKDQTITAPFVTIPYQASMLGPNGAYVLSQEKKYFHVLPEKLDIQSVLKTEKRSRGIFDVVVYTTEVNIHGSFRRQDFDLVNNLGQPIPHNAFVTLGLSDLHNLSDLLVLNWGNDKLSMSPGVENAEIVESGVSVPLDLTTSVDKDLIDFNITFNIRGSQSITFIPIGKETTVHMSGNWGSPSFQGAFFPTHEIKDTTFSADWKLIYLNRNYPQQFTGIPAGFDESKFGMNLYVPVTEYQKNERSAKYAVLIIALTFMVFFFVQVLNKVRIHGIQFMLVGLALCLFYVLLLSFTEHLGFNIAYMLAASMTISLVGFYVVAIFKNRKLSALNFLFLILVYGFVFVIIQLQEYSLLVGSIGLFLVLAAAMYLSRNITWTDQLNEQKSRD
jgi:inner membrane protein